MLLSLVLIVGSYSDVSAQCAGSGYNQGNVALSTAMTCDPAQVGPVSTTYGTCLAAAGGLGIAPGGLRYYQLPSPFSGGLSTATYCQIYVQTNCGAGAASTTCAQFGYYVNSGSNSGPYTNCLNTWGESLAPAGAQYFYITTTAGAASAWNGNSAVLYYKFSQPTNPGWSVNPAQACINTATTYTVNTTASATYHTTGYTWAVSPSTGVTYTTSTTANTQDIKFANAGSYTISCTAINGSSGCNSIPVTQAVTVSSPSVAGTPSVSVVNFCEPGGNFATNGPGAVTVSGQTGTVTWYYRVNGGAMSGAWVTGTSSGVCCFLPETNPSSGTIADGVAYTVQNGVCPATAMSTVIPIQNSYTVTPTLTVTGGNTSTTYGYCSTAAPGSITITANFSTVPSNWGTIKWYAGTCGSGTLMSTTNLSGTTTTNNYTYTITSGSGFYPAAGTTQNYYAQYTPPSATNGCSNLCSNAIAVQNEATPTGGTIAPVSYCTATGSGTVSISGVSNANQYAWALPSGLTGTSTTSSITVTGAVSGTYTVTATPQDIGSGVTCAGTPVTGTVTINPTPVIPSQSAPSVCSLVPFSYTVTGTVPTGTTYAWAAPAGTGFTGGASRTAQATVNGTLTNTTNSAVTATYSVTPSTSTCTGSTFTVSVVVNPASNIASQTTSTCSQVGFTYSITATGGNIVPGTSYAWAAPTYGAGLFQGGSGAGQPNLNDQLFNLTNTTQTATYSITPTNTSPATCTGTIFTVTVSVLPVPVIPNQTVGACTGSSFTYAPSGGLLPAGTTYAWGTPSMQSGLSGGASGAAGNTTLSGTLTNSTASSLTAVYTMTPTAGGCVGAPFTTTVTVTPKQFITLVNPPDSFQSGGCALQPIRPIKYRLSGGAVSATISGIPTGITFSFNLAGDTMTISGSPTQYGTFNYTVNTVGPSGCVGTSATVQARHSPMRLWDPFLRVPHMCGLHLHLVPV